MKTLKFFGKTGTKAQELPTKRQINKVIKEVLAMEPGIADYKTEDGYFRFEDDDSGAEIYLSTSKWSVVEEEEEKREKKSLPEGWEKIKAPKYAFVTLPKMYNDGKSIGIVKVGRAFRVHGKTLFLHRATQGKGWRISEKETGMVIASPSAGERAYTQKKAIEKTAKAIERFGKDKFLEIVEEKGQFFEQPSPEDISRLIESGSHYIPLR